MKSLVAMAAVSLVLCVFSHGTELLEHRDFLVSHFSTEYWKAFCPSSDWHIRCVFIDMDGDSVNELVTCAVTEEDRMGDCWTVWKNRDGDKMVRSSQVGDIVFNCSSWSFCKISYRSGKYQMVGLGMNAESVSKLNVSKTLIPDCRFEFLMDNSYTLKPIEPDFDSVFLDDDVCSIEHVYPEWFLGYDFNLPEISPRNPQTCRPPYTSPKGDLRIGGGIDEPEGFNEFVKRYREEQRKNTTHQIESITVRAVFLDANNDGDADFYITSDLDKVIGEDFRWKLFLKQGAGFVCAKDMVRPVVGRKDIPGLPPVVTASRKGFCRIIRLDVDPIFLIIDRGKKKQVRDAILDVSTHRVEKIACKVYSEMK